MTKNSKKNKKNNKTKYLHIKYDIKSIGENNEDKNQIDYFVNAKTPLAAAKKIWRANKDLDIIYIKDINTDEIFYFSSVTWTNNNGDKFSLNQ
jgi:hypothetical protein